VRREEFLPSHERLTPQLHSWNVGEATAGLETYIYAIVMSMPSIRNLGKPDTPPCYTNIYTYSWIQAQTAPTPTASQRTEANGTQLAIPLLQLIVGIEVLLHVLSRTCRDVCGEFSIA
jgi:hypothetical protein